MFKQDQEIFNILLGVVSEGVIIIDENQTIVEVNRSSEIMFGYEKGELLKQPLNTLIPSNYHKGHASHFENFINKMESRPMNVGRVVYGEKKDGESFRSKLV